ncbi:ATP-binding protein [uncultured Azohydromonas sp.]|uniref:sensor histidine kinase n=1 Tax=uncultured Azohydromonas sp. TaxID=487342 RepID=UPI002626F267|nr:ATP-binding protein [uncultured Azohydromonas sp.]
MAVVAMPTQRYRPLGHETSSPTCLALVIGVFHNATGLTLAVCVTSLLPGKAIEDNEVQAQAGRADSLEILLSTVPWPVVALDHQGNVLRTSEELSSPPMRPSDPRDGLRERWLEYRRALSGHAPWPGPQQVEYIRHDHQEQKKVHETLILRPAPWGYCLFVVGRTEPAEMQASQLQTARLAALGFMIAGVCHEISSPLTTVRSVVQLLRSEPTPDPKLLRKSLDSIHGNVGRIMEIARRLLDSSRPGDEPRSTFAVSRAIDEALISARANGVFERIRLTVRHHPQALVRGNIGQLREVFSNLLLNASQAMDGAGQIDISTTCTSEDEVDVCVADGGPGIPHDIAHHLFEAFFTTRKHCGGTGLGLAISAQIVSEHEGRLWFENRSGGGASFHVQLPRARR